MTVILAILNSTVGRVFIIAGFLMVWLGLDFAYHGRLRNQRDAALIEKQRLLQVVDGFEQVAVIQAAKQAEAAEKAKAVGARTAAIVEHIQSAPAPKTAEEVRLWLISQGKVVVP